MAKQPIEVQKKVQAEVNKVKKQKALMFDPKFYHFVLGEI